MKVTNGNGCSFTCSTKMLVCMLHIFYLVKADKRPELAQPPPL